MAWFGGLDVRGHLPHPASKYVKPTWASNPQKSKPANPNQTGSAQIPRASAPSHFCGARVLDSPPAAALRSQRSRGSWRKARSTRRITRSLEAQRGGSAPRRTQGKPGENKKNQGKLGETRENKRTQREHKGKNMVVRNTPDRHLGSRMGPKCKVHVMMGNLLSRLIAFYWKS